MEKKIREVFKNNLTSLYEIDNCSIVTCKAYSAILVYCKEGICYVGEEELKCGEIYMLSKTAIELNSENGKTIIVYLDLEQIRFCLDDFRIYPKKNRKYEEACLIISCIEMLLRDSESKQWNKNLLMMSHIYQLAYEVTQKLSKESALYEGVKEQMISEKMREIIYYISEHYSENLSLQQLAERYNYSESAMSRFFTKNFGTSFSEYYKEVRLAQAKKDLLYSQWTVADIAMRNGFSSLRSFQRIFYEKNKMTPSEYRKKTKVVGYS